MRASCPDSPQGSQNGQTFLSITIFVALFLLAVLGISTDYAQVWAHRQMAQGAVDAACQAGAADLLLDFQDPNAPKDVAGVGSFGWIGKSFDCSTNTGSSVCKYASLNGYSGSNVTVSFPSSLPNAPTIPAGFGTIANPYIQVHVKDPVPMSFTRIATNTATVNVGATAGCGIVSVPAPTAMTILDPTDSGTLSLGGSSAIAIYGGPQRSIQVNSDSSSALSAGADIDLSHAGPNGTGGDIGVFGGPTTNPGVKLGTTGNYISPAAPISDPFATIPAPSNTGMPTETSNGSGSVMYHVNGCPDTSCTQYVPGYYPSGIEVKGGTSIFDPGIYYVSGGLSLDSNSNVRPSAKNATTAPYGTMFYLTGCGGKKSSACISVDANSGKKSTTDNFSTATLTCPGGTAYAPPVSVTAPVQGNMLMAPCSGTYGDPSGQYRGILFFVDHSISGATAGWGGGGQFIMAGAFYVHNTASSNDSFTMGGNSGGTSLVIGNMVVDTLSMSGTPNIVMQLNPNATYPTLKVQLLE